jgi:hypothetical protein
LLRALGISSCELNFPSLESYEKARAVELERIGKTEKVVGSIVEVWDFIKDRIETIQKGMRKSGPESTNTPAASGAISSPKGKHPQLTQQHIKIQVLKHHQAKQQIVERIQHQI